MWRKIRRRFPAMKTGVWLAGMMLTVGLLAMSGSTQADDGRIGVGNERAPPAVKHWRAGRYLFSDEQGGFSIVGVRGKGTFSDPAIITQRVHSVGPSLLTVHTTAGVSGLLRHESFWLTLYLQLETHNQSEAGWVGYRLELQEIPGEASIYGDGLSFNQITRDESSILSDRFHRYSIEHEPGDRLVFTEGTLDNHEQAVFSLFLLDLSPKETFYIEQQPQLPAW